MLAASGHTLVIGSALGLPVVFNVDASGSGGKFPGTSAQQGGFQPLQARTQSFCSSTVQGTALASLVSGGNSS